MAHLCLRSICRFCSTFYCFYLMNFVTPDRIEKQRKDYCSACVELRPICKEQAWLAKVSERPHDKAVGAASVGRWGQLHRRRAAVFWNSKPPTRCLLASLLTLPSSKAIDGTLWGEPSWDVTVSQKLVPPDTCGPFGPAGQGGTGPTHRLSPVSSPWGRGAETLPPTPPPRPLDTHFEGRG